MCLYKRQSETITSYLFNVLVRKNKRKTQYEIPLVHLRSALGSDGRFCVQSSSSATACRRLEKISNFSRSRALQSKGLDTMPLHKMASAGIFLNRLYTPRLRRPILY